MVEPGVVAHDPDANKNKYNSKKAKKEKKNFYSREPLDCTKENNVKIKGPKELAKRNDQIVGLEQVDPNTVEGADKRAKTQEKHKKKGWF